MSDYLSLCGWAPDPEGTAAVLADPEVPVWGMGLADEAELGVGQSFGDNKKPPVILFDALKVLFPNWARGRQEIGDCVSWGFELACTLAVACDNYTGTSGLYELSAPFATEPIYGGSRVEARGKASGGYSDGSYGGAAAKWLTTWGALERIAWNLETGNPDHDLREYSGSRAKAWGNFGNGGQTDKGVLDLVAQRFKVPEARKVTTFDQAVACIESGYPVAVCSDQGLSPKRDKYGFVVAQGTWYHCMCFTGVRYDRPGLLDTNSWGNSWGVGSFFVNTVTGEVIDYWPEVQKCSAWVDAKTCERMLSQGDSFAITGVGGLKRRKIDWFEGW